MVILSAPRTGSNWLCTLLDSHPDVLCHHEIFNPEAIHPSLRYRDGRLDLGSVDERDRDPLSVLQRVWQADFGHRVVGFKLCKGQNPKVFDAVLADRKVKKILIERRNRVKTFVSEEVAERTGEWESYPGLELGQQRVRIEVDPDRLLRHVEVNRRYYQGLRAALEESGQRWLELSYEALSTHAERRRALDFLGVPDQALSAATRKQNPRDLSEVVANFGALRSALRGSELEPELVSLDP